MVLITNKITTFECKLCKEEVRFNPDDPLTYVSDPFTDSSSETVFNMKLKRYVVKHITKDKIEHYNVVIVDQNHDYRGHKDYYEKIDISKTEYQIEGSPLSHHSKIEYLIIIDFLNKQVLEFVNTNQLKTANLIPKIDDFYKKSQEIYTHLPDQLVFEYISKRFVLLKRTDNIFVVISTFDTKDTESIKTIIKQCNDVELSPHSISLEILTLILKIIDFSDLMVTGDKISRFSEWIFKNTILYVPLVVDKDDLDDIAQVLSKLPNNFSCKNNELFLHVFDGKITVLQYIQANVTEYDCVKQILEIIERRKLITQA